MAMVVVVLIAVVGVSDPAGEADEQPKAKTSAVVGVTAGLATLVAVGGTLAWWRDSGFVGWSLKPTGGFGEHTYAGGADKLGHFFSFYLMTRATAQLYEWLGVERGWSLVFGAGFAFLIGNVIETVDGFTTFGFEYEDVVANTAGVALAVLLTTFPAADDLLGVRIGYVPSPGFLRGDKNYMRLINDYSGMTFYVDFKPAGLARFGVPLGPARYLVFGPMYNTNDYQPAGDRPARHLGLYVGLNVPEILDAVFGANDNATRAASTLTRYYALPLLNPGWMHDLNSGAQGVGVGLPGRAGL